jgi:hypothetical protein
VLTDIELEDAYINPNSVLGFAGEQKPWDLRDRFRKFAVDHAKMFISREDADYTWPQILCGYGLASGALKVKGPKHLLGEYNDMNPLLHAKPEDILTLLRPAGNSDRDNFIRLEGVPIVHTEVNESENVLVGWLVHLLSFYGYHEICWC